MLHYKNKDGKLIIVYDYDELIAHKFATTLIQRGYDNVFMLSGGIRVTQIKFPNCLIRYKNLLVSCMYIFVRVNGSTYTQKSIFITIIVQNKTFTKF